ncbi:hypothetical protein DQ04_03011000 [Trypanosoma grayi]|uniref:hypothetical protein n=1 Tax=Trypanosoma grayi TaxID=71804 RepID=UPI0004F4814F|nr:hypothetical protein DQ04_03011000 [Trypanosoma grayi]KEG11067.1 hypothetical protein DQ04_03011000 [Trypanosoma grayi]
MLLHARLYWETVRGVYRYSAVEYREVLQAYDETSTFFGALSRTVYDEIQLHKKNRGFDDESSGLTETLALALLQLKSVTYMVLPWMTVVAGVVLFSLFGPFILSAVVIPNLVWRVWVQLFVLHHTYGLTVDGFLISLREWVDMLLSKDWAGLQERFMAALISLAADGGVETFYNGIIAMSLVVATVICLLYLMYIWVKVPLMLLVSEFSGEEDTVIIKMKKDRPAGRDSGDGKGPSKGVIRQSTKMTTPPRSSGGAGGNNNNNDASERNRKKKA